MFRTTTLIVALSGFITNNLSAQTKVDTLILKPISTQTLSEIKVDEQMPSTGIQRLQDGEHGVLYSGKKTEVLVLDSANGNTALNNNRELLGKIPGAMFTELQGGGFPSNGMAFRGLTPNQNIELNVRMNGSNLAADVYGYPESYFIPPLEAVERIEVIRGAGSLQFGAQFGGVLNYVLRDAPVKRVEVQTQQTASSFGTFTSYNSIGGTVGKVSYFGFFQFVTSNGYRPNNGYRQLSGFGKLKYSPCNRFNISFEYSALRNRIQMPGGLSDSQFVANVNYSNRPRNYIATPWNIAALNIEAKLSKRLVLNLRSTALIGARELVWRNEDVDISVPDTINLATGKYSNREVEKESFVNTTTELRLLFDYQLGKTNNKLGAGVRVFYGKMHQQGGGLGSTGTDFDLNLVSGDFEYQYRFGTLNIAPFAENVFNLTNNLSITPGVRLEYLRSTVDGLHTYDTNTVNSYATKSRIFPLFGVGLQWKTSITTNLYANWSQAYRPIEYANLKPFASISKIDQTLKDANGYNIDLGWRGTVRNWLNFDIGAFYLQYNKRTGLEQLTDSLGNPYIYQTNVGNSRHVGLESYLEINLVKAFTAASKFGIISLFNSFAYINAKYSSGIYKGQAVENAPPVVERAGLTYTIRGFSATATLSYTAACAPYVYAPNSIANHAALTIPAYTVLDLSASYRFAARFNVKAGVNNLTNLKYFTFRATEYPGPGIIPALSRNFYVGIGAKF